MFSNSTRNKRRLYLAMYHLPPSNVPPAGDPYHYALLWTRKNPAVTDQDTVCYHVIDVPVEGGGTDWIYQSDVQLPARTPPLAALVLLCKTEPPVTHQILETCLLTVPVKSFPGERTVDAAWCVSALKVLLQNDIVIFVDNFQGSPMEILLHGKEFVAQKPLNTRAPVPTCSPHGIEIPSEVRYSV